MEGELQSQLEDEFTPGSYSIRGSRGVVVGLTPTSSNHRLSYSPESRVNDKRSSISRKPLLHPMMYNRSINSDETSNDRCHACGSGTLQVAVQQAGDINEAEQVPPDANLLHGGMFFRQKLYRRLADFGDDKMQIPDHVLPSSLFYVLPAMPEARQSSIVTIFAIWNTMMGTSLLSMPWGIGQSGFIFGIILIVLTGLLAFYTAFRVLQSKEFLDFPVFEFSDVARHYFGAFGEWVSLIFGLLAFIGGMMVYWVLMSNFLYMTGLFIHDKINSNANISQNGTELLCPNAPHIHNKTDSNFTSSQSVDEFHKYWSVAKTVPLYLGVLMFPLMNFKSATFFTKFNCLGTASVLYLWILIIVKAAKWGINMDPGEVGPSSIRITFPALTGMLCLAFFLHNAVITILRNNKNQENNVRDLSIGYLLVTVTYMFVGILFYATFPLPKDCISSNLLDNLPSDDPLAVGARAFLLFQMITVFPLLAYIFRVQLLHAAFGNVWPGLPYVIFLNLCVLGSCVLVGILYPHIGDIIRYSGSLCGLVYVFLLPASVYMIATYRRGALTNISIIVHSFIICLGVANFIAQFLITPSK